MNPYESSKLVEEYLLFHYGSAEEILPYPDGPVTALGIALRPGELVPAGVVHAYLNSGRQDRALTLEDYQALGGVIGALRTKADEAYGEYLAGSCVTCHHAQGKAQGIPPINGLPDVYLVELMLDYKFAREERTNPAMVNIAKNLSDEEIGSLAKHFSKQEPE